MLEEMLPPAGRPTKKLSPAAALLAAPAGDEIYSPVSTTICDGVFAMISGLPW